MLLMLILRRNILNLHVMMAPMYVSPTEEWRNSIDLAATCVGK